MLKIALLSIIFFISCQAFTAEVSHVAVGSQKIAVEPFTHNPESPINSVVLAKDSVIGFHKNTLNLPAGTKLIFHSNQDGADLKVYGLISLQDLGVVDWKLPTGHKIALNCRIPRGTGGLFMFFYEDQSLERGCESHKNQSVFLAQGGSLIMSKESSFKLLKTGHFRSLTKASGKIIVLGQRIQIKDDSSLFFYDDNSFRSFFLAQGERLAAPTQSQGITVFTHSKEYDFPIEFHSNGQISAGVAEASNIILSFNILGAPVTTKFSIDSPLGFDEQGRIDRITLSQSVSVTSTELFYFKRTSIDFQLSTTGFISVGTEIKFKKYSQLFLDYTAEGPAKLRAFPSIEQGARFFTEFSAQPF